MTHRIRLGPPWEVSAAGGCVTHRRRFGRPRTLDPGERVWLVCESVPGPATVAVNGHLLGSAEADITDLLLPRNEVVIDADGPLGEVRLEIRGPALTLDPAGPDDYPFTHDLTRLNMGGYVARHWGEWNPEVYRRNYDATENLILRLNGERVGFVRLRTDGDALILDDLQVRPEFQNRGIGTDALAAVEATARARGHKAVRLRCFHENPAHRLYLRCGFAVTRSEAGADWMEKPV
ncbi:MAG: GNAT family N-acetyltransferase [Gemmataceae bacterium]|nr:GNAT family N-acetyltransferase [Gemmataceae bacterium]